MKSTIPSIHIINITWYAYAFTKILGSMRNGFLSLSAYRQTPKKQHKQVFRANRIEKSVYFDDFIKIKTIFV